MITQGESSIQVGMITAYRQKYTDNFFLLNFFMIRRTGNINRFMKALCKHRDND